MIIWPSHTCHAKWTWTIDPAQIPSHDSALQHLQTFFLFKHKTQFMLLCKYIFVLFIVLRFMTWWGPGSPTSLFPVATNPTDIYQAAEYVAHNNGLTISEVHSVTLVKRVGWSSCFTRPRTCEKQTRLLEAHAAQNCIPCSRRYWIIPIAMWLNCWQRRWMVETCRHNIYRSSNERIYVWVLRHHQRSGDGKNRLEGTVVPWLGRWYSFSQEKGGYFQLQ